VPAALAGYPLELSEDGSELIYTYDSQCEQSDISKLLQQLNEQGVAFKDLQSRQSSLEEIFVSLVRSGT